MLVGGSWEQGANTFRLNPTFFSLNGSLPACLNSTKNDIVNDGSLNKIKSPGLFTNKGEILVYPFLHKLIVGLYLIREAHVISQN